MPTQKEIDEWLELRENCILESINSGHISFWDIMTKFTTPPAKRIKHLSWAMTRCCSEIGCDMKQLAASTVLQRQFRTAWSDIYEQELSKQTLRARIKVAVIDRKKVEAI